MAKVTGIGGVFFKSSKDNRALAAWYQEHLGMRLEEFGGAILKREILDPDGNKVELWEPKAWDDRNKGA